MQNANLVVVHLYDKMHTCLKRFTCISTCQKPPFGEDTCKMRAPGRPDLEHANLAVQLFIWQSVLHAFLRVKINHLVKTRVK